MHRLSQESESEYFLQVVPEGEEPVWPESADELVVGHQDLGGGFVQYWAYPQKDGKSAEELPHAEVLASANITSQPLLIIDEVETKTEATPSLELVIAKDGHAWSHTESSLANLEDNLSEALEFAKSKYHFQIENFTTTARVSKEVEKKLDNLEGGESEDEFPQEKTEALHPLEDLEEEDPSPQIRMVGGSRNDWPAPNTLNNNQRYLNNSKGGSSKLGLIIPVVLLLMLFGGAVLFKDKILQKIERFRGSSPAPVATTPTPTPTATPTPTPSVERSEYRLRVLNGTTKTGAAAALAEKLEDLGWEVQGTGNASNQTTPKTIIRAKKDLTNLTRVLVNDLSPDLQASVAGELKDNEKVDAEVVIGKE